MEFLLHPFTSIFAVVIIGALSGAAAHWTRRPSSSRGWLAAILIGMAGAFLGFHAAMLSNLATGVILMPFAVALVVALLVSFAMRNSAR